MSYRLDVYLPNSGGTVVVTEATEWEIDDGDLNIILNDVIVALFAKDHWAYVLSHEAKTADEN